MRASDDDANETEAPTDWQAVDWQRASRRVRNLRQRIFRASREGDTRTVRSLAPETMIGRPSTSPTAMA